VGAGCQRLEGGEIDLDQFVVDGPPVCFQGDPHIPAALGPEKVAGHLVAREEGGRGPELGTHVRYGGAFRHAQCLHAGTEILEDLSDPALDGEPAQELQDDILGADPGRKARFQIDADDLLPGDAEGHACHGRSHVQPSGADGDHPEAAPRGGMAVGPEQGLPGYTEPFQVHLVADAVTGP